MSSKRIVILAYGTRGDIEPMIALGLELQRAGCRVRLAVPEAFQQFVSQTGLETASLRCGMGSMLSSPRLWKYYRFGFLSRWLYIHDIQEGIGARALEDAWSACRGCDVIVFHPMMPFATDIAEAMAVPCVMAAFQPLTPTRDFPLFSVTSSHLSGSINRLSYNLMSVPYVYFARRINRARRRLLGLRRRGTFANPLLVRGRLVPAVYGISGAVVAPPEDWGSDSLISGYWFSPPSRNLLPPPGLVEFLAAGPKPIYIGFGSNPVRSPENLVALLGQAVQLAELRAVICLGAPQSQSVAPGSDPGRVFLSGPLPHDWLFARVAAAVHHGGAGTVASSLRAGLPTLVCPLLIDQSWWADCVHELGAGPPPIRYDRLSPQVLAARLRDLVSNPHYASNAADIAQVISTENGVGRAAEFILKYANPAPAGA